MLIEGDSDAMDLSKFIAEFELFNKWLGYCFSLTTLHIFSSNYILKFLLAI